MDFKRTAAVGLASIILSGCSIQRIDDAKTAEPEPAVTAYTVTETNEEDQKEEVETLPELVLRSPRSQEIMGEFRYDETSSLQAGRDIEVNDLTITTISVSCLKVEWNAEDGVEYSVKVETGAPYSENITFVYKENGLFYLTGLREDSDYIVTITPQARGKDRSVPKTVTGHTERVTVIAEYEQEEGWTGCFAGERASGLTLYPSLPAIEDTIVDPITDTGIRRNEYGDYCCAMGLWYGEVGDRFLIELDNGTQFTVEICDSKGMADDADGDGANDGRFHWFDKEGGGKCVVEFIYDDDALPDCVAYAGSWGYWDWNGLDLEGDIESVEMITFGEEITY